MSLDLAVDYFRFHQPKSMWSLLPTISHSAQHRLPEFPLQLLQDAIDTREENTIWKILKKQHIRDELIESTTTHKVPSDPQQEKYNVFTCVQAAVQHNLPRVVLTMYRFNPGDVRLATWYALYRLKSESIELKVSHEFIKLAQAQRRVWLRDQIGAFLLLRQCKTHQRRTSRRQEREVYTVHPVAMIPGEAFQIILSYVDLHENREARILKFLTEARPCPTCSKLCLPGHCKAKRLRKMERRASRRLSTS